MVASLAQIAYVAIGYGIGTWLGLAIAVITLIAGVVALLLYGDRIVALYDDPADPPPSPHRRGRSPGSHSA